MTNQKYFSLASLPRDEVFNLIQAAVAEAIKAMSSEEVKLLMKSGLVEFNVAHKLAA